MSDYRLTSNQQWVLHFLEENKDNFVSPTIIGSNFKNGYHSSFASPICKKLCEYGLIERNEKGHYKFIKY